MIRAAASRQNSVYRRLAFIWCSCFQVRAVNMDSRRSILFHDGMFFRKIMLLQIHSMLSALPPIRFVQPHPEPGGRCHAKLQFCSTGTRGSLPDATGGGGKDTLASESGCIRQWFQTRPDGGAARSQRVYATVVPRGLSCIPIVSSGSAPDPGCPGVPGTLEGAHERCLKAPPDASVILRY